MFLAGEGSSEEGYGRWLKRIAERSGVHVAVNAVALTGGDPLDLVEVAINKLGNLQRTGTRYRIRGLLLDDDRFGENPGRDVEALAKAEKHRLHVIRQRPDHEGFLVRHFTGYETRQPSDSKASFALLKKVWPEYKKGMDAIGYERKLKLDHLTRARSVEPELNAFLELMGWN